MRNQNSLGVASLICGVLSLVFFLMLINIPLIVAAVVLGVMQIFHYRQRLFAVLGMSAAAMSLLLMLVGWVAIFYGISNTSPAFMEEFQQQLLEQYQLQTDL